MEGIVTMRKGENPSQVLARVQEAVKELNETEMPPGRADRLVLRSDPISSKRRCTRSRTAFRMGITLVVLVLHLLPGPAVDGPAGGDDDPVRVWCSPWCCCT